MMAEKEWIGLESALERMATDYDKFRDLSLKQRKALIENNIPALSAVLLEMEDVADSIFLMDDRRRMHMEILSEGCEKEILNLEDLLDEWPSYEASSLRENAKRLRGIRAEIEALAKVNAVLIRSSREFLQATVEAIVRGPNSKRAMQKAYGSNGMIQREKPVVRNMLNRRG
jgi:hypothetical protein